MPTKKTVFKSSVPDVRFRSDGKPRWIVRFRHEGVDYQPPESWYVDLSIKNPEHKLHWKRAQEMAEERAIAEKRRITLVGGRPELRDSLATEWTVEQLARDALEELDKKKELGTTGPYFVGSVHHKSWKSTRSNLRVLLGLVEKGANLHGFPSFYQKRLSDLTLSDFVASKPHHTFALDRLYQGKRVTFSKFVKTLQWLFKYGKAKYDIDIDPTRGITFDKSDEQERDRVLTDLEFAQIQQAMQTGGKEASAATRGVVAFERFTAVRRSEACNLKFSDVNLTDGTAVLRDTKGRPGKVTNRTIPLDDDALQVVRDMLATTQDPQGFVFSHEFRGEWKPVAPDSITQAFGRARSRVAKQNKDPTILTARNHDLRHTRITELGSHLTAAETASISGHKDLRMLLRYFNPVAKNLRTKLVRAQGAIQDKGKLEEAVQALLQLEDADMILAFQQATVQRVNAGR